MAWRKMVFYLVAIVCCGCLGCSSSSRSTTSTQTFTIGGTVSGLSGTGLVLQDNGANDLPISTNDAFVFTTPVASGGAYAVTVSTQPQSPAQSCVVTSGTGTAAANVTNVLVSCAALVSTKWSVGNAVSAASLNNTDADTSIIRDANGKFWLIQSDPVNAWNVLSGSNIDNLTEQYSFNTVGNFAQPNGDDAYWVVGAWIDPDTGTWYGVVHVEFDYGKWPGGSGSDHFRRISLATSTNNGQTWALGADIITPYYPSIISTTQYPGSTFYFGDGDPKLYVDSANGYFYLYYMSAQVDKTTGDREAESIYVARAPITGKMAAGSWSKWYSGSFSQPGIAGQESAITLADSFLVSWSTYLGQYIGVRGEDGELFVSGTLSNNAWSDIGNLGIPLEWYNWPIDSENLQSRRYLGQSFRLYSADTDYEGIGTQYWPISFTTGAGAPPVNSTTYYQIVNHNSGLVLGIANGSTSQGAQVVQQTAQTPASAEQLWQVVPNGDGFYHIVNKNSGLAIGIAASGGSNNAQWRSELIQWNYGSATLDQMWCLEPTESGYYKLCSRNSDQVVGIANPNTQSGVNAITWPDVFGAEDQEFTFVSASQ